MKNSPPVFPVHGSNARFNRIRLALGFLSPLALTLAAIFSGPRPVAAGFGSASICLASASNSCMKTMVLGKASPVTIVRSTTGPMLFSAPATLFVECPTNNNCGGACPGGHASPVSAKLTIAIYPYPCSGATGTPTASGTISTAAATMALPASSNFGSFTSYIVPISLASGTSAGIYCVKGIATVTFSDGVTLTQTGDTMVCLVEPAPGQPSIPRLDLVLLSPPALRAAPGDQAVINYRVTNNDPTHTVFLAGFATSKQVAVRPQGGNESQGVFAISNPFGDDFPISFNNVTCVPLPSYPYFQPEIITTVPPLAPGQNNIITVRIRSYGQCASGSCCESTLRVQGTFSDSSPAFGAGGCSFFVDTGVATFGCGIGINDCNSDGIPDAVDIQQHSSQDDNHNGVPDECEVGGNFNLLNPAQITPQLVAPYQFIQVQVLGTASPQPITNVLANGISLTSSNGFLWTGTIRADTRPGPQTVYFMARDAAGRVSGQIGTYNVISNGPPLTLQAAGNNVTVLWPNIQGPFTLQVKTNLADAVWTDVMTTFAQSLTFQMTAQAVYFRLLVDAIPDDPIDYELGRPVQATFYAADVQSYWVHYGIPPLSRLSNLLQDGGTDPTNAFEGLMQGFDEPTFNAALSGGLLPLEFSNHVAAFEFAGQPPGVALINTFRDFVDELDTVLDQQGTNAPRVLQIYQLFADVFPQAFQTNGLAPLAPQATKQFSDPVETNINWVDIHFSDSFTTGYVASLPPFVTKPDDTNTTSRIPWSKITNSTIWNTTYNGACAAVANGASMAKLNPGQFPAGATCQFWNDFSCLIGTGNTPLHVGAYPADVAMFYDSLGYSCIGARKGLFESAVEEAKAALDRGCDVTLFYEDDAGTMGHVEMVEAITVDPNNSGHATVHTLSWGSHPSVDVNAGRFSGKTDGARYGGFLADKGKAFFRYYCKK